MQCATVVRDTSGEGGPTCFRRCCTSRSSSSAMSLARTAAAPCDALTNGHCLSLCWSSHVLLWPEHAGWERGVGWPHRSHQRGRGGHPHPPGADGAIRRRMHGRAAVRSRSPIGSRRSCVLHGAVPLRLLRKCWVFFGKHLQSVLQSMKQSHLPSFVPRLHIAANAGSKSCRSACRLLMLHDGAVRAGPLETEHADLERPLGCCCRDFG
jgi:hypothetical protein